MARSHVVEGLSVLGPQRPRAARAPVYSSRVAARHAGRKSWPPMHPSWQSSPARSGATQQWSPCCESRRRGSGPSTCVRASYSRPACFAPPRSPGAPAVLQTTGEGADPFRTRRSSTSSPGGSTRMRASQLSGMVKAATIRTYVRTNLRTHIRTNLRTNL